MPSSEADKQRIIRRLLAAKQEAHSLEISLRFKGQKDQADQLAAKTKTLSNKIDTLLAQVMAEWEIETDKIISDLALANVSLDSSIQSIKSGINVAQNVVKVLGFVDDLIAIAAKIAAAAG